MFCSSVAFDNLRLYSFNKDRSIGVQLERRIISSNYNFNCFEDWKQCFKIARVLIFRGIRLLGQHFIPVLIVFVSFYARRDYLKKHYLIALFDSPYIYGFTYFYIKKWHFTRRKNSPVLTSWSDVPFPFYNWPLLTVFVCLHACGINTFTRHLLVISR